MYERFFGLSARPFGSAPQTDFYVPARAIEAARTTLARCVERGEGVGTAVGPTGTGKTMLCLALAEQVRRQLKVALLSSGRLATRRALLQAVLYELGQPYRHMDEGELRLALVDYLTVSLECPHGVLLLVDEADRMPLRMLDELRMLTNIACSGQPRVRLVLVGGCALEERLANPRLDALSQRIAARCYLEPLGRAETREYVYGRLRAAGGKPEDLFPEESCEAVHQASDGVPRLINQVCDHVLLLAYAGGQGRIEPAYVEEAWADLQQLPSPWSAECRGVAGKPGGAAGVVEFGCLDEGDTAGESSADRPAVLRFEPSGVVEFSPGDSAAERLDHIERLVSEAADDFRPAGTIGPEAEVVFDDAGDPFEEPFEEEELICERFGALRREPDVPPPAVGDAAQAAGGDETAVPCAAEEDDEEAILAGEADAPIGAAAYPAAGSDPDADAVARPALDRPREYRQLFSRLRRARA
jgi:type II secretory pathway predicted ATPase ExeA